jgi:hypothetical protein
MAKKKGFLDGYKTYNPKTEGYGNEREWRQTFAARMGFDEAQEILRGVKDKTPLGILGLSGKPAWNEIRSAYRKMARQFHPDVYKEADATQRMQEINAAYVVLERQYGK